MGNGNVSLQLKEMLVLDTQDNGKMGRGRAGGIDPDFV